MLVAGVLMTAAMTGFVHRMAHESFRVNRLVEAQTSDIRRSEQRMRHMVDAWPSGLLIVDQSGKITFANPNVRSLFGYEHDELVGQPIEILVPLDVRPGHPELRDGFFKDPKVRAMGMGRDLHGVHKNGHPVSVEVALSPFETENGLMAMASVVDITARKRHEQRITRIIESWPNGLLIVDQSGKITFANPNVLELFGYEQHELVGQPIEILVPSEVRPGHSGLRDGFFQNPQVRAMGTGRDLHGVHKDGRFVPVEVALSPFETDEGLMAMASIIDITQRKAAEEEHSQRTAELERSNMELDRFAYVASHDLKAPLRGIDNLARLVIEDTHDILPDESRDDLQLMQQRVDRMERLLDDLLAYSRVGRKEGQATDVDTDQVVNDVVQLLGPPEGFVIDVQPDMPTVHAPLAAIELTFRNLISNAIKHHDKPNGRIEVHWRDSGDFIEFAVSDNGPGIPSQFKEKVFEMFQTLKPRDEVEGSGMGLALVKKTIESRGGKIALSDGENGGAVFTFTWPKNSQQNHQGGLSAA